MRDSPGADAACALGLRGGGGLGLAVEEAVAPEGPATWRTTRGVVDVAGDRDHHRCRAVVAAVEPRGSGPGSSRRSTPRCPRWADPAGCRPTPGAAKRLCTTSSGSSSCIAISSRMTSRSASTSSSVIVEPVTMSPSTSTAAPGPRRGPARGRPVYSLAVKALNSPPTASSATEMSSAERSGVPLKSRCSRKCEQPCRVGVSSREPTPTHTPMLAERAPAICSVTTRRPLGRTVRRTREVDRPVVVLDGLEGAGGAVLLHGGPSGAERVALGWSWVERHDRPAGRPAGRGGAC